MIAVCALTLAPGRMGGSENYVRALMSALARVGVHEYLAILPPDALGAAGGLPSINAGASSQSGRVWAFSRAAVASPSPRAQVVHYPLTVPVPRAKVPRIVTLHDVQHRDQPDFFSRKALALRAVTYDRAARHANLVIVPSAFVKDAATSAVGLDPGRVRVIPHGVDHAIFRPGIGRRDPFVFYPARFWPHKNHARLFEAFALVKRERPELELVLSGGGHTGRKLPAGVRSVGLVDERRLVALYQTAEAMVFPSLYEGFGSPVLEAMACGCPVAASAAGSLPEVAGGAATLFDPRSADKIALGILRALEQRDSLSRRGLERAKEFTWDASAVAHDAVYAELLPCG